MHNIILLILSLILYVVGFGLIWAYAGYQTVIGVFLVIFAANLEKTVKE